MSSKLMINSSVDDYLETFFFKNFYKKKPILIEFICNHSVTKIHFRDRIADQK